MELEFVSMALSRGGQFFLTKMFALEILPHYTRNRRDIHLLLSNHPVAPTLETHAPHSVVVAVDFAPSIDLVGDLVVDTEILIFH